MLEWYEDRPIKEGTYKAYQKKVIKKWRRFKQAFYQSKQDANDSARISQSKPNDDPKGKTSSIFCKYCHSKEHLVSVETTLMKN